MAPHRTLALLAQAAALLPDASRRAWHGLPDADATLDDVARRAARHADGLRTALRLADLLDDARIPYLLLKGPLLQELLYREHASRPYTDLDVAVPRSRIAEARRLLRDAGWRRVTPAWMRPFHFHDGWRHCDNAWPLELHHALVDRANFYRLPEQELFDRRRMVAVPGGCLAGPGPEDLLIYLCLHAHKHGFLNEAALAAQRPASWFLQPAGGNRLLWFLDIALLLQEDLDAPVLARRVEAWNVVRPVASTLLVLDLLLPDAGARAWVDRLGLGRWQPRAGTRPMRALLERVGRDPALRTNTALMVRPARLAQLSELFFPPPDEWAAFRGTAGTGWTARLAHPARMAARLLGVRQ
jgi:hypothetical protein